MPSFNDKLTVAGNRQTPLKLRHKQNIRRPGSENAFHQPHCADSANQRQLQSGRKRLCLPDLRQRAVYGE